jgi:hypothetical protein
VFASTEGTNKTLIGFASEPISAWANTLPANAKMNKKARTNDNLFIFFSLN